MFAVSAYIVVVAYYTVDVAECNYLGEQNIRDKYKNYHNNKLRYVSLVY